MTTRREKVLERLFGEGGPTTTTTRTKSILSRCSSRASLCEKNDEEKATGGTEDTRTESSSVEANSDHDDDDTDKLTCSICLDHIGESQGVSGLCDHLCTYYE